MIFDFDGEKLTAALDIDGSREIFVASIGGCENPTCRCETARIYLTPVDAGETAVDVVLPFDISKKSMEYPKTAKVSKKEKKISEAFLKYLADDDVETIRKGFLITKGTSRKMPTWMRWTWTFPSKRSKTKE